MHPIIPYYYERLREAQAASDAVDMFDLVSSDEDSVRRFNDLRIKSLGAQMSLITFVATFGNQIMMEIGTELLSGVNYPHRINKTPPKPGTI